MIEEVKLETAKKVKTFDLSGRENGWLMELYKDGSKTIAYLTAAFPGAFKGYHMHTVRATRYVCIRGRMKIILYRNGKREEHILDAGGENRLFIPANVPTGLQNIGEEEGWLINYPDPPYDPSLLDEQVDFIEEELERKNNYNDKK
ncbi:MAG: WxcM-like domain-containing protein [Candidatus Doudnabacteria bacterium]|nr:WxcM-like domain-containing protein [Candidatus Doudnabacteria bacterium]